MLRVTEDARLLQRSEKVAAFEVVVTVTSYFPMNMTIEKWNPDLEQYLYFLRFCREQSQGVGSVMASLDSPVISLPTSFMAATNN